MKAKRGRRNKTIPTLAKTVDLRACRGLHLAIIEKVGAGDPLSINERGYVAEWLMEAWLPKHEVRAVRRQRQLASIETLISKTTKRFAGDWRTLRAQVAEAYGFPSQGDMETWIKRERKARKIT